MTKVSVLVPIYNVETYLHQCLESIVKQTLNDIEILCVNDGSTDNSLAIINEFAETDPRIIVLNKENGGYGSAINAALLKAQGEYIGVVESDDWIDENMFFDLYQKAEETKADIVKGTFWKMYPDSPTEISFSSILAYKAEGYVVPEKNIEFMVYESSIWSAIYRRNFLSKNNIQMYGGKGVSYQDTIWKFMTYAVAESVYLINKPYYYYRVSSIGSSSRSDKNPLIMFDNYLVVKDFLIKLGLFNIFKQSFYLHEALDVNFHYQRLSDKGRRLLLAELKRFVLKTPYYKSLITSRFREIEVGNDLRNYLVHDILFVHSLAMCNNTSTRIKHKAKFALKQFLKKIIKLFNNDFCIATIERVLGYLRNLNIKKSDEDHIPIITKRVYLPPIDRIPSEKKKMLFFAPFTSTGGARTVLEYLCNFYNATHEIHLITYSGECQSSLPNISVHFHVYPNGKADKLKYDQKGNVVLDDYDIDEWCNDDLLSLVYYLKLSNIYDIVLVNYVFFSKVFTLFDFSTKKILMTHDVFTNRNSRQFALGLTNSLYFSTTCEEEQKGLNRADIILSLQPQETLFFRDLTKQQKDILTLRIINNDQFLQYEYTANRKLRVGYFASEYLNNFYAFTGFLNAISDTKSFFSHIEFVIAGKIGNVLKQKLPAKFLDNITFLGYVQEPVDFYSKVDIVINPDRFASGLKIKSIEAFSYGTPLLSTKEANTGINSDYEFHNFTTLTEMLEYLLLIVNLNVSYIEICEASRQIALKIKKEFVLNEKILKDKTVLEVCTVKEKVK